MQVFNVNGILYCFLFCFVSVGNAFPVGGTHTDPVTNLPVPIELGSLCIDRIALQPIPIMGVTIDEYSGDVIPVGGMTIDEPITPILLYDTFTEIHSRKSLKVTSVRLADMAEWEVERLNGGERALYDVNELYHESRVIDALHDLKDALTGPQTATGRHEENIFETAVKDLQKSRTRVRTVLLRDGHDLVRRLERASILSETGGSPGMYEYISTGQLLPILVGAEMKDPSGSGLDVQILGVDREKETGNCFPLSGTVEDPLGDGLVPIVLGEKVVDPVTQKRKHCIGVKYNHDVGITEPVTASAARNKNKKRKPPFGAVSKTFILSPTFLNNRRFELTLKNADLIFSSFLCSAYGTKIVKC